MARGGWTKRIGAGLVLLLAVVSFGAVILIAGNHIGSLMGPRLRELELNSSP